MTTPGAPLPISTTPAPTPVAPAPSSAPTPTQLDSSYIGAGGVFGVPSLAGGLLTAKVGPAVAEASLTILPPLLYAGACVRGGLMFPTSLRVKPEGAGLSAGVMFGGEAAGMLIVLAGSGYTAVVAADWIVPQSKHISTFLRVTAGVNLWTSSLAFMRPAEGLWLTPTIGISGGVLWQPSAPE